MRAEASPHVDVLEFEKGREVDLFFGHFDSCFERIDYVTICRRCQSGPVSIAAVMTWLVITPQKM